MRGTDNPALGCWEDAMSTFAGGARDHLDLTCASRATCFNDRRDYYCLSEQEFARARPDQSQIILAKEASMTEDFRKRILNVEPSVETHRDWGYAVALESGAVGAAPIPDERDLRADWWAIGDQGQTGSCVGWACADAVLRWHFVSANRLGRSDLLSVRHVWMASKETDQWDTPATFIEAAGTSLKAALDVARKYGVVPDSVLPFASPRFYAGNEKTFYAIAAQRKISSYFSLGRDPAKWREWIANSGPILTRLDCDSAWFDAADTAGVLTTYVRPTEPAGHAVSLVGYTADHFIVRNSWGTGWGDQGFAYAQDAYAVAAFTEAYGVAL